MPKLSRRIWQILGSSATPVAALSNLSVVLAAAAEALAVATAAAADACMCTRATVVCRNDEEVAEASDKK